MIVKCNAIYNRNTKEYVNQDYAGDLIVGNHYNVLEVCFRKADGIEYRISTDSSGLNSFSILVLAKDFEIITNNIPDNWILYRKHSALSPHAWRDMSLWNESFWQDYNEDSPKAIQCYRDEIKKIVAVDKDYIQIMIDERADYNIYKDWQDTMLPLFAEVLGER